jgi:hypothetical protein
MFKIDLKKSYSGTYMGVKFAAGLGHTDSPYLAGRFRAKGYEASEVNEVNGDDGAEAEAEGAKKPEKPPARKKKPSSSRG